MYLSAAFTITVNARIVTDIANENSKLAMLASDQPSEDAETIPL